ncbi:MAG TPA: DUF6659 family protein [Candidatus Bathyarchaeia archaeon]|nr:DUF6659 family protein [Candidatus Bathyarchaeia archaeon]
MKADEFSTNVLDLDSKIRFVGLMDKSGHLHTGRMRQGFEEYLKAKSQEVSFSQTAHIVEMRKQFSHQVGGLNYIVYAYDKVKIYSIPLKNHIIVLSAENSINTESIVEKISGYVKSIGDVSIFSPSNIVDEEKKEVLKNLLKSDIPEELIAEQLDLDPPTVRELIREMSTDNPEERK